MKRKTSEREKALTLRAKGMSYSQIKKELNVSKSSLSLWLYNHPLSAERVLELQANSPIRIERYRETMRKKREREFETVYQKVKSDIGLLSDRDLLIGGIFLYWGEGSKTSPYCCSVSNTDPDILKTFIKWLALFGIDKNKLHPSLHLYKDMNIKKEIQYWSKELGVSTLLFKKPYIKDSKLSGLTYKTGFGHGTCNVRYYNKFLWQYSLMSLKYIREQSML